MDARRRLYVMSKWEVVVMSVISLLTFLTENRVSCRVTVLRHDVRTGI